MVFFGLELMKDGFEPVSDLPTFSSMFQMFEATDYVGVLKSALVGCVVTLIIQSSSATLGITIALANTGAVDQGRKATILSPGDAWDWDGFFWFRAHEGWFRAR